MINNFHFILASKSPRRNNLLKQIGLDFSIIPSDIYEDFNLELPPEAFTEHWARQKAKEIGEKNHDSLVIGADTIVVLDKKILGKPKNKDDSFKMLKSLSGRRHEVITGVSFFWGKNNIDITINERTFVYIKALTDNDIYSYINTYEPLDKAGSYGIQDGFSIHIQRIDGCYFNVMGLPISSFYKMLKSIIT